MIMPKSASVIPNPHKPHAFLLKHEVERFVKAHGLKLAPARAADLVVTVGGDGTILYKKKFTRQPIFGIGSERSFICQATTHNWMEKLDAVLHNFSVERRSMLSCALNGKTLEDALNEVCVRNREHTILSLELLMDGKHSFRADGIIFSTPTGSSGYSYSCGGEELQHHTRKFVVAPIAPYRRALAPMTVSDSLAFRLIAESECKSDVVIDGQFIHPLRMGKNEIVVRMSKNEQLLVRAP